MAILNDSGRRNHRRWTVLAATGIAVCLIGPYLRVRDALFRHRAAVLASRRSFADLADKPMGCVPLPTDGVLGDRPPADFNMAALPSDSVAGSKPTSTASDRPAAKSTLRSRDDLAEAANLEMLRIHYKMLKQGSDRFRRIPGYLATFERRERVGSVLLEPVTMQVKIRRNPFSVYLKWLTGDPGKELLYVDGANDGQMLVRLGGFKGRLLPAINVDPFGSLAMSQSRYPIQSIGILALTESLIEHRQNEIRDHVVPHIRREPDASCDGRPCSVFTLEITSPVGSPVYRKSIQYLDRELGAVIQVANCTWPELGQSLDPATLDDATFIEYYKYSEIVADAQLSDSDFDRSNSEYHFRR